MNNLYNLKKFLFLFVFTIYYINTTRAQELIPVKGKEFWMGFLLNYQQQADERLDFFIVSDVATSGTVSIPLQGFSVDFDVVPNVTTTVNIPNILAEPFSSEQIEEMGVFIEALDTISVFAINFKGFTADGSKILPIQSLGTEYMINSYDGLVFGLDLSSEFAIVATEDGTVVEITPSANTVGGHAAGVPFTVAMDAGELYLVKAEGEALDLTGSTVKAAPESGVCRTFAVFSGVVCANIPYDGCTACDHIYEQEFPTNTWGKEYYVVPFDFASSYSARILAKEDNTIVTVNGDPPFVLNAGEYEDFSEISEPYCVNSDKGINVTQFMNGITCAVAGDPAMLFLNDSRQQIKNITFSTVESTVITDHGINIVVQSDALAGLTLDEVEIPVSEFSPFPSCPDFSYAQIEISEGSHTLNSLNGFTAYAYGTGSAESYAYSLSSFTLKPTNIYDSTYCTNDTVSLHYIYEEYDNVYWYAQSNPDDTLGVGLDFTIYPPIVSDVYVGVGIEPLSGCFIAQIYLVETPVPVELTAEALDSTICKFQTVQLNVTPDPFSTIYQYTWTPIEGLSDPHIQNPTATPLETTTYTVFATTPSGCSSNSTEVTVFVTPGNITSFDVTAQETGICLGEEVQLNANVQNLVFTDIFNPLQIDTAWAEILNGVANDSCGSASGNALYFNGDGQRSATTVALNVLEGGNVSFAIKVGSETAPCENAEFGEDIVLEYSTSGLLGPYTEMAYYYEFSFPEFTYVNAEIPVGAQTINTLFRWRQLENSGTGEDNWAIDDIVIGTNTTLVYNYQWTPPENLNNATIADPVAEPGASDEYFSQIVDDFSGCTYIDSVEVLVGLPFTLELPNDTAICSFIELELYAIPSGDDEYEFVWSPDDGSIDNINNDNPTVTPSQTTTYTVNVVSNFGCEATGQVEIVKGAISYLGIVADPLFFCAGDTANLLAEIGFVPPGVSFTWSPNEFISDNNSQQVNVYPDSSISYNVLVLDSVSGCILKDTIELNVTPAFTLDAGPDRSVCEIDGYQLTVDPSVPIFLNYLWLPFDRFDFPDQQNPIINGAEPGWFVVQGTSVNQCFAIDSVYISQGLIQEFTLGADTNICIGTSVELSSGYDAGFTHLWSTNDTTANITVNSTENYILALTSIDGCTTFDDINVTVRDLPIVDLGLDRAYCIGEFEILDATNQNSTYAWSNFQQTPTIAAVETNEYYVTVTNEYGCVNSDTVNLVFNVNPIVNFTSVIECDSIILTNTSTGYTSTLWSFGDFGGNTSTETNTSFTYPSGSSYNLTLTVTNDQECSSTLQLQVDIPLLPISDFTFTTECANVILDNNSQNATSYSWQFGDGNGSSEENPIHEYDVQGDYFITLLSNNATNCESTLTIPLELINPELDQMIVPNTFSPNGDDLNELFIISNNNPCFDYNFKVYNRWGQLVHSSINNEPAWDGKFDGALVASGTYFYTIESADKVRNGSIAVFK
jgi:gliding motility-associated-like protein